MARYDWILNIDADERISKELFSEIKDLKQTGVPLVGGYYIKRKTYYLGKWIRYCGWYPDKKLRLYQKEKARWHGRVHEHLNVDGEVSELRGEIEHFTYRDISDHIRRTNRYASIQADDLVNKSYWYLYSKMLLSPPLAFLKRLFLKQGFREGFPGFVIGSVASFGTAVKYMKALEKKDRLKRERYNQ